MHEFDLSDPDQRNEAAANYVLGLLDREEKARFESLLAISSDLQAEVEQWREHLDILNTSLPPVEPPATVWKQIEAQTKPQTGWLARYWWQSLAGFSLVVMLALGVFLQAPKPIEDHNAYVYLIHNEQQQPGWMVNTHLEDDVLEIQSLRPVTMPKDKFYELWLMLENREPLSLGFMPRSGSRLIKIDSSWREALMHSDLVVTMEGPQGAPSGYQMGPVSDKASWKPLRL